MTIGTLKVKDSTGRLSNGLSIGDFLFPAAPTLKPLLGACTSNNTTWATLKNAVGQFQARRTFEGGGATLPTTFAASKAAGDPAAGMVTVMSFKPNQDGGVATFPVSTIQKNWWRAFLNSWPLDHPGRAAGWHEPGDNIPGSFTLAQYKAFIVAAGQIVQEVRAARGPRFLVEFGPIWEGEWDFDSTNTSYGNIPYGPNDWSWTAAELAVIDWIGFDPYLRLANQPSMERLLTYDDSGRLNTQTRAAMQKFAAFGKKMILGEWGVTSNSQSDQAKADKIRSAWAWMKAWNEAHPATPIEIALYFHYNLEADVTWEVLGTGLTQSKAALTEILADARA